jgi:hypothetical protein
MQQYGPDCMDFHKSLFGVVLLKSTTKFKYVLTLDTSNRLTIHSHEDLNQFMKISYCILLY